MLESGVFGPAQELNLATQKGRTLFWLTAYKRTSC